MKIPAAPSLKIQVQIGKNKIVEAGVIVGEHPSRKVKDLKLVLGNDIVLRSGTVLYLGSRIGDGLQTGHHAIIREENVIGNHFCLWSNSVIDYGCRIGDNVKIHCNCYVAQFTTIEDDVFMAPGVTVANDLHPGSPDAVDCMRGPTIKKGAQIGCNVTLLPHVVIGEHSLIGAGSVVTKDIPPYSLAYGNPARVVKKVSDLHCRVKDHAPYQFLRKGETVYGRKS
ncbi:MAG: N-acetyltransferase [Elusimicrobia bacterium]|nr:N-acetyltransferase [Elusimicrobiota bacterium]